MSGIQYVWADPIVATRWHLPGVVASLPHLGRWASGPTTADLVVSEGDTGVFNATTQRILIIEPSVHAEVPDGSSLAWAVLDSAARASLVEGLKLLGRDVSSEWVVHVPPGTDASRTALAHVASLSVIVGEGPRSVETLHETANGGHWRVRFASASAHVDITTTAVPAAVTRVHAVTHSNSLRAFIPALDVAVPAEATFFGESGAKRAATRWESGLRRALRAALLREDDTEARLEAFRRVSQLMNGERV